MNQGFEEQVLKPMHTIIGAEQRQKKKTTTRNWVEFMWKVPWLKIEIMCEESGKQNQLDPKQNQLDRKQNQDTERVNKNKEP